MTEQSLTPPELPSAADFMSVTQRIIDMEYEYISGAIGADAILRDLDERKASFEAIAALSDEEYLKFVAQEQRLLEEGMLNPVNESDLVAEEFSNTLQANVGPFDDFELIAVTPSGININKNVEPTEKDPLGILVLSLQLTKDGKIIAKKFLAMDTTPLPVTPEDIATLNKFVAALKTFQN